MHLLGIAAYTEDSAVCLLDESGAAAARESGFSRSYNPGEFPLRAFNHCLQSAEITAADADYAVLSEKPFLHFASLLAGHLAAWPSSYGEFVREMPLWLERRLTLPDYLRRETGFRGTVLFAPHHAAHAAAAFYQSGFERAALLVMDSGAESAAVSLGEGWDCAINLRKNAAAPHSPALLFNAMAEFLGLRRGEKLIESAASCGKPVYEKQLLEKVLRIRKDGALELNAAYFERRPGKISFSPKIQEIFGKSPQAGFEFAQQHFDMAASIQAAAERAALAAARALASMHDSENLCLGGGLFHNAHINSRLKTDAGFKNIFVPELPGNAGTALGAALYARHDLLGQPRSAPVRCCGPAFTHAQMRRALINSGLPYRELDEATLAQWVSEKLAAGRMAAWFQGGAEFSAAPLCSRAVLAAPFNTETRSRFNAAAKHGRPFQLRLCICRSASAGSYFDDPAPSAFVSAAKREKLQAIPAAAGPDGTARVLAVDAQRCPAADKLLEAFEQRTGVPLLLAAPMNFSGEPCAMSPSDAVEYFKKSGVDCMALGSCAVEKAG